MGSAGVAAMGDWIAFWNSDHSIYVDDRHRDLHYRAIADDIAALVPSPAATVVDFGCGEALHADRVAAASGRLILVDAAEKVRAGLARRFTDVSRIAVRSPPELAGCPDGSVDLVVMNSVAQYVGSAELDALLASFRRLLRPGGLLVVGDVVPPDVSPVTDARALLKFAARGGFLGAAILGLIRTVLSDYSRLRSSLGLARYDVPAMTEKLAAAGFTAERAATNIGHNQARITFLARPA
jgi:SAM-dependent methyltransferase